MGFVPHTERDAEEMLGLIGVSSVDDLFADIPETARLHKTLNLPDALSEIELDAHMRELASLNNLSVSFAGAGAYSQVVVAKDEDRLRKAPDAQADKQECSS